MEAVSEVVEIFYSYAHADERSRIRLGKHLSALRHKNYVIEWHDRKIAAGQEWAREIDHHLNRAHIIILLISADFMDSQYCYGIEMRRALERHEAGEARVIPILLRPVDFTDAPFAKLEILPTNHKPVSLWRPQDLAWQAIANEISAVVKDLLSSRAQHIAIPPSQGERGQIWNVPAQRNPYFTGRTELLRRLHEELPLREQRGSGRRVPRELAAPIALYGHAGIGKTSAAIEYAYRHAAEYEAVLWVNADSREALALGFVELASILQLPVRAVPDQDLVIQAVRRWLATHEGWLLILDNADDLELLPAFLPTAVRGHIIITTRYIAAGALARRLQVVQFSPHGSQLFLLRRAGLISPDTSPEALSSIETKVASRMIADCLERLPLALDQAGAYIEETGCSLQDYIERYAQCPPALLRRRGRRAARMADHPASVAATWNMAFSRVEQENPLAADLLRYCSFLHPDAIPEELFTQEDSAPAIGLPFAGPLELDEAIATLRRYALVQRDPTTKTLSVHRLVQEVIRDGIGENEKAVWKERVVRIINRVFPDPGDSIAWPRCKVYILHIQFLEACTKNLDIFTPELAFLCNKAGFYLYQIGQYAGAEPLLQRALSISEQLYGPVHVDVATSMAYLADLYAELGKDEQAEALYQRTLAIREEALGPDHPDVASALNDLALFYRIRHKERQAQTYLRRALAINQHAYGPKHPTVALILNNLGMLYQDRGDEKRAEVLLRRALAMREETLGADHPDLANSLTNLANLYTQRFYADERAGELYRRALAIRERAYGELHPDVARSLNNLAVFYAELDDYAQAEALFKRMLALQEQLFGSDHPDIARTATQLARLYELLGDPMQAEAFEARARSVLAKGSADDA